MNESASTSREARRVAPIRVVNLASLQDIKVVKKQTMLRPSRRKSIHQIRENSDDEIQFIESSTNGSLASISTAATHNPIAKKRVKTSEDARPNDNLMKRVALLRVCAEYMLEELQIKNISFGENQSLEMLQAQYVQHSRIRDANSRNRVA